MNYRLKGILEFATGLSAFLISVYAVSNLMPLLLLAFTRGLSMLDSVWISFYSLATLVAIGVLERLVYRLDKRAGRIRNKSELFR